MAWIIGGVTLEAYEEPDDGFLEFGQKPLWAYMNPIGFMGRVRQLMGADANEHELHLFLGEVTKEALNVLALHPETAVLVSAPRPRFEGGLPMTIDLWSARWTKGVPGCWSNADLIASLGDRPTGDAFGYYDCTLRLVELSD